MRITVVGAGLTGLAAALFLGRRGHDVSVIERDEDAPTGDTEEIFEHWDRRGVPQARQPHAFLGRSVRVLRDEAPDVLDGLLRAGALRVPMDLGDGPDDAVICCRRLTYETVLRRAVLREPRVTLRTGTGVDDLLIEPGPVPVVRGIRTDDHEPVEADLIVDAAGRRSPTARLLTAHGARPMPESAQECGFLYVSRHFRLRAGCEYPSTDLPIMTSLGWAAALAFPGDCGTFSLLATISVLDPLRRQLTTDEGFARFHASVDLTAPWLEVGEPISPIRTMARVENRYRRLVDADGPIVTGMVLLGDSTLHTNPTAGRGVSLAFAHAQHLAEAASDGDVDDATFACGFDAWTDANIGAWYLPQAGADASMIRRMDAAVRGEEPPPAEEMELLRSGMIAMARQPGPTGVPLRRMMNLVSLPVEVLSNPAVLASAAEFTGALSADRPSRSDYAASMAALV